MNVSYLNYIYVNVISKILDMMQKFWDLRSFVQNSLILF